MAKSHYVVEKQGIEEQMKKKREREYPTIISGSKQDANDPNILRGDKEGAYKGATRKPKEKWYRSLMRIFRRNNG